MTRTLNQTQHITVDEKQRIFHLRTNETSYLFQIVQEHYPAHLYWGSRLEQYNGLAAPRYRDRGFSGNPFKEDRTFSLDTLQQEFPSYGQTDFRDPAVSMLWEDGSTATEFHYGSYRIISGKPALKGLPATYAEADEAETLIITLREAVKNVRVELTYTVLPDYNTITRSSRIIHDGVHPFSIQKLASANVDFSNQQLELLSLPGAHERERDVERRPLVRGGTVIESRRGSSSHQQNPFVALLEPGANETTGSVYAFNLVYSGSFKASIEVDQLKQTRINIGINPFDFSWHMEPGDTFQAPEVVMIYSDKGLGHMSRTFHNLYNHRLVRGQHRLKERPILINNWEATYFDFDEAKILEIAEKSAQQGVELFVLDDGWFGTRNNDKQSLGDWTTNKQKLPGGLTSLGQKINNLGMKFGIWFEPEMISVSSELYKQHPDWCLHVPNRRRSESRNQLVLDLANPDAKNEIIRQLKAVLSSAPIEYVKWDMNRNMTEIGSPSLPPHKQRETAHRYMLGLYEMMEELTTSFPHILFESCSGGGGRFDPGMLYYMPQTWTSDNTDAISRAFIQYGTSLVYPTSTIAAHVSAAPNHQTKRITSLKTRGDVAMEANFGYELDVTKEPPETLEQMKHQITHYKKIRKTVQYGTLHRLTNPYTDDCYATIRVNEDQTEAVFLCLNFLATANGYHQRIKLAGLSPNQHYYVDGLNNTYTGDELMKIGIPIPYRSSDFETHYWHITTK